MPYWPYWDDSSSQGEEGTVLTPDSLLGGLSGDETSTKTPPGKFFPHKPRTQLCGSFTFSVRSVWTENPPSSRGWTSSTLSYVSPGTPVSRNNYWSESHILFLFPASSVSVKRHGSSHRWADRYEVGTSYPDGGETEQDSYLYRDWTSRILEWRIYTLGSIQRIGDGLGVKVVDILFLLVGWMEYPNKTMNLLCFVHRFPKD